MMGTRQPLTLMGSMGCITTLATAVAARSAASAATRGSHAFDSERCCSGAQDPFRARRQSLRGLLDHIAAMNLRLLAFQAIGLACCYFFLKLILTVPGSIPTCCITPLE